jgi:hypothetical protein
LQTAQQDAAWQLAPDNHEGVRVSMRTGQGEGWFLLRMSLHDPVMPLNLESDVVGGIVVLAKALLPVLARFDALDLTPLTNLLYAQNKEDTL